MVGPGAEASLTMTVVWAFKVLPDNSWMLDLMVVLKV
jgi:hypothetical protein